MATVANDIIRVTCNYTYQSGGRPLSNVLHFADVGAGGIIDSLLLTQMGVIIEGKLGPLAAQQSVELFFTTYDVFNVTQGLIIGTLPWPTLVQGAIANQASAPTVVGLLRMITNKSKVQGRVNLVGVAENIISSGVLTGPFVTAALVTGANLLLANPVGPSSMQYVVYNQALATFTVPVATALGTASRSIGRRHLP